MSSSTARKHTFSLSVECHVIKLKQCTIRNNWATYNKTSNMYWRIQQLFPFTAVQHLFRYVTQIPFSFFFSPLLLSSYIFKILVTIPDTHITVSFSNSSFIIRCKKGKAQPSSSARPHAKSKGFQTHLHWSTSFNYMYLCN